MSEGERCGRRVSLGERIHLDLAEEYTDLERRGRGITAGDRHITPARRVLRTHLDLMTFILEGDDDIYRSNSSQAIIIMGIYRIIHVDI